MLMLEPESSRQRSRAARGGMTMKKAYIGVVSRGEAGQARNREMPCIGRPECGGGDARRGQKLIKANERIITRRSLAKAAR